MIPKIEDVETPVVGKIYRVKTVYHHSWASNVPIYGPEHEDREFIKFPDDHYHVDWRFVSDQFYRTRLDGYLIRRYLIRRGQILTDDERKHLEWKIRFLHGVVVSTKFCGATGHLNLKMRREMPSYPLPKDIPWLKALEEAYAFARLGACLTCPHRGLSLKGLKPNKDGTITCTGHGLTWNPNSGFLVRST